MGLKDFWKNKSQCSIAKVVHLPGLPAYSDGDSGKDSFSEYYCIIIGGENPCACGSSYWQSAKDYEEEGEKVLPARGDSVSRNGKTYVVTKLSVEKERRSATADQCRKVTVKVDYEPFSGGGNLPSGTIRLNEEDIPTFPCRMKFGFGTETVPAENAQWMGFFDYKGDEHSPVWKDNSYVCQPLRQEKGTLIPITNSAGVAFDPPLMVQRNTTKIRVARPFSQVNINSVDRLKNSINCDEFFAIEFRNGIPTRAYRAKPFTAKITDVNVADDYTIDSGKYFTWVTLEVTIRRQIIKFIVSDGMGGQTVTESDDFGWDDLILNTGLAALRYPGEAGPNGDIVQTNVYPALTGGTVEAILDKDQNPIAMPTILTENGVTWKTARTQDDENAINTGVVCSAGRKKEDLLYLRWRHYDAVKYASDTTLPGFFKNGFWPATTDNGLPTEHFPNWASEGSMDGSILADYEPETCE